mgnify:CR=1 FL=1|jgi:hypothetical protein
MVEVGQVQEPFLSLGAKLMKFEIMAKVERNGEEFIVPRFWVEAENGVQARSYARQIVEDSIAISAIEVGSVWALENPGRHGELISNASR